MAQLLKKISTPTNNNEKAYITAGTGSNEKYKFVNAAHNGNGGTTERYGGDNDSSFDASTNDSRIFESRS